MVGNGIQRGAYTSNVTGVLHINPGARVSQNQTFQSIYGRVVVLPIFRFEISIALSDLKCGLDGATAFTVQLQSNAILTDPDFDSLHAFVVWPACDPSSNARSSGSEITGIFIFRAFCSLLEPESGSAATKCVTSLPNVSV